MFVLVPPDSRSKAAQALPQADPFHCRRHRSGYRVAVTVDVACGGDKPAEVAQDLITLKGIDAVVRRQDCLKSDRIIGTGNC